MARLVNIEHISPKGYDFTIILMGVFLAPIYEEICCRLWLVASKRNYLIVIACLSSISFVELFRGKYLISIIFITISILLVSINFIDKQKIKTLYLRYFRFLFWFSALLFGLLHATNFRGCTFTIIALSPLLCLPQIIMGFILGYIRMSYGFWYGVLLHFLINSTLLFNLVK